MSESEDRGKGTALSAGEILALHAQHREGLHATPHPDCIQCTFDGLMRRNGDGLEPMGEPEPT